MTRLVIAVLLGTLVVGASPAQAAITRHGAPSTATFADNTTTRLTVAAPSGAQAGDLLLATLGVGHSNGKQPPVISAPAGWTLVTRGDQGSVTALAVYRHVFAPGERSYSFTTDVSVGGAAFVAAYSGVDRTDAAMAGATTAKPAVA